jgi:hypothetical protein
MEGNVYVLRAMVSERLAEARKFAAIQAELAAAADGRGLGLRERLGATLIALGQRLRDGARVPVATRPLDATRRA